MMTGRSRLLLAAAALLLGLAFVLPLWSIGLTAPQYRDGLGMYIGISDIRGHNEHDIQNINILNHYIGMRPIEPEKVPELRIMPWVLAGLMLTGLGAAALGRRWVAMAWLALFVVLGVVGMADFYSWKYDYGHNLSPDAPIKVPGMTYQPPLIGTKQLLNITASSWPSWGTLALLASALLATWAVLAAPLTPGNGGTSSWQPRTSSADRSIASSPSSPSSEGSSSSPPAGPRGTRVG